MLKQTLNQKLLQKLSPQQIQLMKLLQIPTSNFEQRIKEELEINPALEEGDEYEENYTFENEVERESDEPTAIVEEDYDNDNDYEEFESLDTAKDKDFDDYIEQYMEDDPQSYNIKTNNNDDSSKAIPVSFESSFHEHLEQQLGVLNLESEEQELIALQIIGSIDEDGYLRREPIAIVDDLMFSQNIITNIENVESLLTKIQTFDPPGVGARDLRECLLIQLHQKIKNVESSVDKDVLKSGVTIIFKYFDEFSKKHYLKMQKGLGITEDKLKIAIDEILKLNPKPASGHSGNQERILQYIVPDFIIENKDGVLELLVDSRNVPDLRINDHYKDMLKAYKMSKAANKLQKEAVLFIKQKIDSAKWFIDAIKQREQTMFKTMYAIMHFQYEFFLTGDQKRLRPMILKDIADITGLDISTVSRVANSKFVQTEFGTKRLKDFFSESLQTSDGEEVSTLEVKKILTDIIVDENKKKPYSDEKLKILLMKKGYNIARRTVAKYREQLNVPVARLRKQL
jgi:RNA polymerase sigma-54 factor